MSKIVREEKMSTEGALNEFLNRDYIHTNFCCKDASYKLTRDIWYNYDLQLEKDGVIYSIIESILSLRKISYKKITTLNCDNPGAIIVGIMTNRKDREKVMECMELLHHELANCGETDDVIGHVFTDFFFYLQHGMIEGLMGNEKKPKLTEEQLQQLSYPGKEN